MKILFQCNTVYQLLVCLHMRLKMFKNYDCDILISNIMNSSDKLQDNLIKSNVFTNVYLQEIKGNKINKINKIIRLKDIDNKILKIENFNYKIKYDLMFISNTSFENKLLFHRLKKNNKTELVFYEDGLMTYSLQGEKIYFNQFKHLKKIKSLNYELKKSNKIYIFNPSLMLWKSSLKFVSIDKISADFEELTIINNIFGYEDFSLPDDCKTIYFEESYLTEGKKVNDLEIIVKCIKKFGNDGFYIKRHPRNRENRFNSLNIKVLDTDSIPWELIVLNNMDRIKDITLLSIDSSTIFNPTLLFGLDVKSYSCENMVNDKKELYDYIPDIVHKLIEQYDNINYLEL